MPAPKTFIGSLLFCLGVLGSLPAHSASETNLSVDMDSDAIRISTKNHVDRITVRIVGGDNYHFQKSSEETSIVLPLKELNFAIDGRYQYEVSGISFTGETKVVNGNGRVDGAMLRKSTVTSASGQFQVADLAIVVSSQQVAKEETK